MQSSPFILPFSATSDCANFSELPQFHPVVSNGFTFPYKFTSKMPAGTGGISQFHNESRQINHSSIPQPTYQSIGSSYTAVPSENPVSTGPIQAIEDLTQYTDPQLLNLLKKNPLDKRSRFSKLSQKEQVEVIKDVLNPKLSVNQIRIKHKISENSVKKVSLLFPINEKRKSSNMDSGKKAEIIKLLKMTNFSCSDNQIAKKVKVSRGAVKKIRAQYEKGSWSSYHPPHRTQEQHLTNLSLLYPLGVDNSMINLQLDEVNPSALEGIDDINPSALEGIDDINPSSLEEIDEINPSVLKEIDEINPSVLD